MAPDTGRIRALLQQTVGPAPWYWESFPPIRGAAGQHFVWNFHGTQGALAYLVSLSLSTEPDVPRLALNTYVRPFVLEGSRFGLWCPQGKYIRMAMFDADKLKPFDFESVAGWFKQSTERIYSATEPVADFEFEGMLPQGTHAVEFPKEFHGIDEMQLVSSYPAKSKSEPHAAIYVAYPQAALVEVLPQLWFTAETFDIGYQWISRIARDPVTHRLVGEGVRIGGFELTEDGCNLAERFEIA
ncbi:MAG TPA: hypothetical protein VGL89_13960 [Candidatus Koribacter sp.]|jgi:hypothetical protein